MRIAPVLAAILLLPLAARAVDTAYSALRVLGKQRGQHTLEQVLELRGRAGAPEPSVWKVIISEPSARGGVREFDVQRGQIIAERAPTASSANGAPMNFTQLNLDSEGAFTVANQEMEKAVIAFDRIDYVLRSGNGGGAPVWRLEMFDGPKRAGSIEIAADTGSILQRNLRENRRTAQRDPPRNDRQYLDEEPPPPREYERGARPDEEDVRYDRDHSRPGEPFRDVGDFFYRLGKRFERRAQKMENFFTGRGGSRERRIDDEEPVSAEEEER